MLILFASSWLDRMVVSQLAQQFLVAFAHPERFRLSLDTENPFQGRAGISVITHRPLDGFQDIIAMVRPQQCQHALSLLQPVTLPLQQAFQKLPGDWSQPGELRPEFRNLLVPVLRGTMSRILPLLPRLSAQQRMTGHLADVTVVDE